MNKTLTSGTLKREDFNGLLQLNEYPVSAYPWTEVESVEISAQEELRLSLIDQQMDAELSHVLNEATIWARAIYPLLSIAETNTVRARAEVSLSAQFDQFSLSGIADGVLGKTVASRVTAPYLVVVEAKKGIEATDPIIQMYGQMLAAAWLNGQENQQSEQIIYGCYTIANVWTFTKGTLKYSDEIQPGLNIEYSREYSQHSEGRTILKLLKQIVAQF